MNREIKFRAYHPKKGWYPLAPFYIIGETTAFDLLKQYFLEEYNDIVVIQQYTGKNDINGNPIYEGDLVEFVYAVQGDNSPKASYGVYEIFYNDYSAAFYLRVIKKNWFDSQFRTTTEVRVYSTNPDCPLIEITELPLMNYGICRVIGNIFDNPEFLDK